MTDVYRFIQENMPRSVHYYPEDIDNLYGLPYPPQTVEISAYPLNPSGLKLYPKSICYAQQVPKIMV